LQVARVVSGRRDRPSLLGVAADDRHLVVALAEQGRERCAPRAAADDCDPHGGRIASHVHRSRRSGLGSLVIAFSPPLRRAPLTVYTGADRPHAVPGIELVAPESDEDFLGAATAQWEAYKEAGPVAERAVDSLRRTVAAGGIVVLARDAATRESAGAGACTAPSAGASE